MRKHEQSRYLWQNFTSLQGAWRKRRSTKNSTSFIFNDEFQLVVFSGVTKRRETGLNWNQLKKEKPKICKKMRVWLFYVFGVVWNLLKNNNNNTNQAELSWLLFPELKNAWLWEFLFFIAQAGVVPMTPQPIKLVTQRASQGKLVLDYGSFLGLNGKTGLWNSFF